MDLKLLMTVEIDIQLILHIVLYVQLSTLNDKSGMYAVQAELVSSRPQH